MQSRTFSSSLYLGVRFSLWIKILVSSEIAIQFHEADRAYTREIIASHLEAKDRPTVMACLFGDVAAHNLGYPPQGLSPRAGLALALHEAKRLKSK
jgi:hypothetical protein